MNAESAALLAAGAVLGWLAHVVIIRRLDKKRARFLSFMAHEINGPITALNMTVMNFIEGTFGEISKEQKPWFVMIRSEVARLAALVGDLRDFLHLDFHRDLQVFIEEVDLTEIIKDLREELSPGFERSQIAFKIEVPDEIPLLQGDTVRLRRVLGSMLVHARKFRTEGPVAFFVETHDDEIRFRVEYRGLPSDPATVSGALELYAPVENPNSQVLAGVGAGLGLARALIAAHGGRMTYEVDEDGGTRIAIFLPRPKKAAS